MRSERLIKALIRSESANQPTLIGVWSQVRISYWEGVKKHNDA